METLATIASLALAFGLVGLLVFALTRHSPDPTGITGPGTGTPIEPPTDPTDPTHPIID